MFLQLDHFQESTFEKLTGIILVVRYKESRFRYLCIGRYEKNLDML